MPRRVPYLLVFFGSLGVDLIPIMAPPAWTVMAFAIMTYRLNPWFVLASGVPASALGRYLFSLYIPKFSDRMLAAKKKHDLNLWARSCAAGCRSYCRVASRVTHPMLQLELLLGLFLAAVILAALARRVGAPIQSSSRSAARCSRLCPIAASFTLPPELALALFVAPILLDAAYDASLRDLQGQLGCRSRAWSFSPSDSPPLAVAVVARSLIPEMPWAPAIALGAIVAPPDAVAATAVLRQLRPPHRILTILEGESLLNDASALLIYRLAVGAVAANGFSIGDVAPTFLLAVAGSLVAGPALGWLTLRVFDRVAARADRDHPAVRHDVRRLDARRAASGCPAC